MRYLNKLLTLFILFIVIFTGCTQVNKVDDITELSIESQADYLLFEFIKPYERKGYINALDKDGELVDKYVITDKRFGYADVFDFDNNNFYFPNSRFSGISQVMKYNSNTRKFSFINTGQEAFIDKYYKDEVSEYIATNLYTNEVSDICDIKVNKCITTNSWSIVHTVSSLDKYIINVETTHNNHMVIKKYNRDLEELDKTQLIAKTPNLYPTYTREGKLYLFLTDGDILEVDRDLNVNIHPMDFSAYSKYILEVYYRNNVKLDENSFLTSIRLNAARNERINLLVKITFEQDKPKMELIQNGDIEDILNADYQVGEVYTSSYTNDQSILTIRDINSLEVINQFFLNDTVDFVDKLQ
ncbi:hypothetical protein [Chengkuizengella sediminis]|uniref:hypothetical protein n=1 Tax=Chengkuizengella sediminis TaxID=1885917 RepID=UPI0013893D32|nr:hypothetical protein [Chengkuizengella sediminis]NDI35482.1 hypothetical protein [Chengkuizengella sediminis]